MQIVQSFLFMIFLFALGPSIGAAQSTPDLDRFPIYDGDDLGLTFEADTVHFRLWSPVAEQVRLHLYETGIGGAPLVTIDMDQGEHGSWKTELSRQVEGQYYTVQVLHKGQWLMETPDPYAKAVGVNGLRGQVLDVSTLNPPDWEKDTYVEIDPSEVILYELHLRDVSTHSSSGIRQKGKFLGLVEEGTQSMEGLSTGLDHIAGLGITHLHLLPAFDFRSIDESRLEEERFNWGYDPAHYNVPEGSFSTDPFDGKRRILEFKQMVQALHRRGIGVILDVVYNHTGATEQSVFNQVVPHYYYRHWEDGQFANASACGNETASERHMVRKFIIESLLHWVKEYHIDGFRFDLMGIHDMETMNAISSALREVNPDVFLYGEGWTAGESPLPVEKRALKKHTHQLDHIAAFSDDLRDGLKGSVFVDDQGGFVSGLAGNEESVKFGIVAATSHPEVDYEAVNYSNSPWALEPTQCINYVSCHDNHTLWDKLLLSRPDASSFERVHMHHLALAIVLTAQGIPFLHAGVEMRRTKNGVENSFESPDSINQIQWSWLSDNQETVEFLKQLITLRKMHPAFRMKTTAEIQSNLSFEQLEEPLLVGYRINGAAVGDAWGEILVWLNGSETQRLIQLPEGNAWSVALSEFEIDLDGIRTIPGPGLVLPPISATILFRD